MSYSHLTQPDAEDDLRYLIEYFIKEASLEVSLNFLDAVEDSANRITTELNNRVQRAPKFDDIYGMAIKADPKRKNYAKDFSDYYIWYSIDTKNELVIIWAFESIIRDPDRIRQMLKKRRE